MNNVQANAEHRGTFIQGTTPTLMLKVTDFDGEPIDPETIVYDIINNDSGASVASGCPEKGKIGFYAFEWEIDPAETVGYYTVTWTYVIDDESHEEIQTVTVAEDCTDTTLYSGRVILIRQGLELMIGCAQSVPVYYQQARPSRDRQTYQWTKGLWNQTFGTNIYRNGEILLDAFDINYNAGTVIFNTAMTAYDVVNADYNFRWFSDEELDRFLWNSLQTINGFPPHSRYGLHNLPDRYVVTLLYGAAKDLLRNLMMCLNFEEPAQFFGGGDQAQKRFSQLETLKQNYEKDWLLLLEQKKYGPYVGLTKSIVVPEYTLPGGRSRWFRMLFSGSTIT